MARKTVLVAENEPGLRTTYSVDLRKRGFEVKSAGTIREARQLIEDFGTSIDVAVLDMKFENDPDEAFTNGAQLGLELKKKCGPFPPEFLIRSGYAEIGYYKDALDLGAAAYLSKQDTYPSDVIQHVRALALRRYLKIENPNVIEELNRIAATTKSVTDSVLAFCEHTLAPNLKDCLGAPFVLLLTDKNGTQNCASNTDMPLSFERVYHILQAVTHGNADPSSPYLFDVGHLGELKGLQEELMAKRLEGAAFVGLASIYDYRLSLGILKAPPDEIYPEDAYKLAAIVARYVRSTVLENFIKILVQLDTKRKTTLGSTSQLCLFLGQDQLAVVDEGIAAGELQAESLTHQRLQLMAEDLEETGAILMNVAESVDHRDLMKIDIPDLLMETWKDLSDAWKIKDIKFHLEGTCSLVADEEDLYVIITRVLQWLAQRKVATEPRYEPTIYVQCDSDDRSAKIVFEDRSRRLPSRLRERLFEPFTLAVPSVRSLLTSPLNGVGDEESKVRASKYRPGYLPLYLAKTLVEEKYRGSFEDKSDEMADEVGHRLVIQFHKAYEGEAMNAIFN